MQNSNKFWLEQISLSSSIGFSPKELRKLEGLVQENQAKFLEAWDGYFGSSGGRES
ncbi:DUF4160 domain-containing protein [Nostoc sp.]|uniref:DUF4160 domain-containing protein n=1 Tax=Nostoc sp. TaxID=1180 RepID=UPI003FA594A2